MSNSIVFYDIPSTLQNKGWSVNTLKTRLALNYKGLPYKTVWLEYLEIEPLSKNIGAPPTTNKPDGRPHYTLPMIHDLSTGAVVSDSNKIAAYLDETYPNTPRLLPVGTIGMHLAFQDAASALFAPLWKFAIPAMSTKLNPVSEAYFRFHQEAAFSVKMEDITPTGEMHVLEWQKVKDSLGKIDEWFRANGEGNVYLMGNTACYADLWMAAHLAMIKSVLPDKWEEMKGWHDGRWARLSYNMEKHEAAV
ncbi:hypothetical protein B0H19DRAFT_1018673 [Mycena capillaripes]|nr:hypothetical protein B0H19DRAFT_1018673 [Mycena capillaripes]